MTVLPSTGDDLFNLELIRSYVDKTHNPRFVERHWLKQEVEKRLADPNCRFLLLTAEPGAGKSAFMAWLADCNPAWSRYFIRRDQRTPLGDVGAHSLLLQIGFQLAALYPDLFDQEQIEITVRQRIGQANDSRIVGAEIERIVASPFRRKVVDIQQDVKENRRTAVTGVQIGEIYQDVRLVPIEDLQYMALFDPAIALARINPDQQIVILIDALDELSYGDLNGTLVQWLTKCPELPPNVRFVLTARPNTSELELFCETKRSQIQTFPIEDNDPRVRSDLLNYVVQWVEKTPKVQAALQAKGLTIKVFSEQAVDKADGNLGYLEAIARAVDQVDDEQIEQILDWSALPQELEGLYVFFLKKIKSTVDKVTIDSSQYDAWFEVFLPVLGILAIAREPLTLREIQQLGNVRCDWAYLSNAIKRLCQFLDEVDQNRYRLYHSTFPEFLTSKKAEIICGDCYVEPVKNHRKVVQHYKPLNEAWQLSKLEQLDSYGLRHLTQHLVQANLGHELHQLLDLDKGELNAWFEIKASNGDVSGFLADVALAWRVAEEEFASSHQAELLGLQYRYALLTASVNNLSTNIPTALLIALVKTEEWKPERALAYAQQISDSYQRSGALRELAPYLHEPLRSQAYQTALKHPSAEKDVLTDMLQYAPHTLLQVLPKIQSRDTILSICWRLGEHLPDNSVEEAIQFLDRIEGNREYRAEILVALAPSLLNKLSDALDVLPELHDLSKQSEALARLILYLPDALISKAVDQQPNLESLDSVDQAKILSAWFIRLPELLPTLRIVHSHPPVLGEQALKVSNKNSATIRRITEQQLHQILTAIIPQISESAYLEIVTISKILSENEKRSQVLFSLIPKLAGDLSSETAKDFFNICDWRELRDLIPSLPEDTLIHALKVIWRFEDYGQEDVLSVLLPRIPKSEYLHAIQITSNFPNRNFPSNQSRDKALLALTKYLPDDLLPVAYQASRGIQYEVSQLSLTSLEIQNIMQEALKEVQNNEDAKKQLASLKKLIPFLPSSFVIEILDLSLEIKDKKNIQESINSLFQGDIEEASTRLLENLGQSYREDKGDWIDLILNTLPRLPRENIVLWGKLLQISVKLQSQDSRVYFITSLFPYLPEDLKPKACKFAQEIIQNYFGRRGRLSNFSYSRLFIHFPELASERFDFFMLESAYTIIDIIPFLPGEFLPDIVGVIKNNLHLLEVANKVKYKHSLDFCLYRAFAPEVIESALSVQGSYKRLQELKQLVPTSIGYLLYKNNDFLYQEDIPKLQAAIRTALENQDQRLLSIPLPKLLLATSSIQDAVSQVEALTSFSSYSPEAKVLAFTKTASIKNWDQREKTLVNLISNTSEDVFQKVLSEVNSIPNGLDRCLALKILSQHLPANLVADAIRIALDKQNLLYRTDILGNLWLLIPAESFTEIFKTILEDERDQLLVLQDVWQIYKWAIRLAVRGKNGYQMQTLSETLPDFLKLLAGIMRRSPEFILRLREELRQDNPDFWQDFFGSERWKELPAEVREILFDRSAYPVLAIFLSLLPLLEIVLLCGELLFERLGDLFVTQNLPPVVSNTPEKLQTENEKSENETIEKLLRAEIVRYRNLLDLPNPYVRKDKELDILFDNSLIDLTKEVLPFLRSFNGFAPELLMRKTLEMIQPEARELILKSASRLSVLPNYLEQDLYEICQKELNSLSKENSTYRRSEIIDLVSLLPTTLLPKALEVTKAFQDDYLYREVFENVFSRLPAELVPKAIELAKIDEQQMSLYVLGILAQSAPEIPELQLSTLLDIAQTFQSKIPSELHSRLPSPEVLACESSLSSFLVELAPRLTAPLLQEALEMAKRMRRGSQSRNDALKALAPYLPLSEALIVIQEIDGSSYHPTVYLGYQIETLKQLVERFAGKSLTDSYTLWQASLHLLAERSHERKVLLTSLEWLAPLIKDLGMQEGFSVTLQNIERVVKWYP